MTDTLIHRGPDGHGYFTSDKMSLGHRRLSIIDLSEKGKEPMHNEDNYIWLVFNGEIYNHMDLRKTLKRHHIFKSKTDCEVLLHLYEEQGIDFAKDLNGEYAFAIWDTKKRELFLVRDKAGVKPLYYYWDEEKLIFASEMKAILEHDIKREINEEALSEFIHFTFTKDGTTLLNNIYELLPGHIIRYQNNIKKISIFPYYIPGISKYLKRNESISLLKTTLKQAVLRRLMSDVPLGVALSGGLDCSIITGILSKAVKEPIKTFTVGFGSELDEFKEAKIVAEHCKTEHTEIHSSFDDLTKNINKIVWHYEGPFARPAVLSNFILGREIQKHIKVAYCGEGGDELFAGYNRYDIFSRNKGTIRDTSWGVFNDIKMFKNIKVQNVLKEKISLNLALLHDIAFQIPGCQTRRVDRMTMAHSTEFRFPYLDNEVIDLSLRIKGDLKYRPNAKKYILQLVAKDYLPTSVVKRKKFPFGVPMHEYFQKEFIDYSSSILQNPSIKHYLNIKKINGLIEKAKKQKPYLDKINQIDDRIQRQILFLTTLELWHKQLRGEK